MASRPGHPGRPNEDFVGAVPCAVVLLDGAGIPGAEHLCHHGTAWYAHTLGGLLLSRLARGPVDLSAALADTIDEVAGRHRGTCDLADPSSPQAAVAIARAVGDRLDYLVLADAYVVLDDEAPSVLTDPREVSIRAEVLAAHDTVPAQVRAFRARRNQPGGYWIAKDSPAAAAEAVTGSVPLATVLGVAVLSNGVPILDGPGLVELLRTEGPHAVLGDGGDDATAAYWSL